MSRNRTYSILVITLLVVNILLLGFLVLKSKKDRFHKRPFMDKDAPKRMVIKRLNFDDTQIASYDSLVNEHRKFIHERDDEITNTKMQLYQFLSAKKDTSGQVDSLTLRIANLQKEIETAHFNHFKKIRGICNESQYSDYEELTRELPKIFQHMRKKKRRMRR